MTHNVDNEKKATEFEQQAERSGKGMGIFREFWYLLSSTRSWWMAPLILALVMVAALVVMGSTAVGPFIYALF